MNIHHIGKQLEDIQRLGAERSDIAALTGLARDGFHNFSKLAGTLLQAVAGLPAIWLRAFATLRPIAPRQV